MPESTQPTTIIIGGGLAGLAAATALADRGVSVTVLESRPRLGGRASSFVDHETDMLIDNCQHVSMGCCTNFRHFQTSVGIADCFHRENALNFIGPDGGVDRFAAKRWPAPFHLLPAFRRLTYLSRGDLRAIGRGLRALCRERPPSPDDTSFLDWLVRAKQPISAIERFWHVVLVSALSESLDRIDIGHARKVFVDGFLANRHGWEVDIPTTSLDELYGSRLQNWMTERGATIRLQAGVERIVVENGRTVGVEFKSGEQLDADFVVAAVPYERLSALLPPALCDDPVLSGLKRIESAPISSVHLWFDRPITELPHAVFVDRLCQWMFHRTRLQRTDSAIDDGRDSSAYYQIVISASRSLRESSQEETIASVVAELTGIWPETSQATLLHARVITEHKAVFSVLPGIDKLRPAQQSPVKNLQWAGDWTATGWPATMEGAVRSGYLAAENILKHLGRPEPVLQPDLPVAFLSKLLLRL